MMQSRFSFSHLPWIALLAMGCSTPKDDGKPTASTEPQAQAVERIKQLCGEFVWENNDPNKSVVQVHLSRDKVADGDLHKLSAFPQVRVLSLTQTAVTEEGIANLASLKSLRVLGLSGRAVTDGFLHRLADLEPIEEVEVGDTAVTCAGWAELARMKNLRQLTLLSRHVSDADLPALAKLHQIHSLLLKRATITGEGLSNLSGMGLDRLVLPEAARTNAMLKPYLAALKAPIKRLGLRSWEIDDVGLEHLVELSELTELYLGQTRVGDNGLDQLTSGPGGSSFPTAFVKVQDRIRELADLKSEGNPAPPGPDATKATEVEELGKWIMTYYQNPDPKCFVERVRGLAAAKLLHDSTPNARPDANVMFLGKIMAANAPEIAGWMAALSSLSEADFAILKRAVWYSGTAEGTAWLAENGEADLANGPRPMLLSDQKALSMQPYHIDQLWEWFFATGDKEPVVQIVRLFSLAHELPKENSLDLLSPPKESDDSTQRDIQLYNYRLVKPALWSTTSLAIQHDRVYEIVKECADRHHPPMIKAWLGQILRIADAERSRRRRTDPKQ